MYMHVNVKMISVETIAGMEEGMKVIMEGVNSSMKYLIYCKNFCKYYNVPSPAQQ
jgi:hypothetical protein